jgi:hypothetical protein
VIQLEKKMVWKKIPYIGEVIFASKMTIVLQYWHE